MRQQWHRHPKTLRVGIKPTVPERYCLDVHESGSVSLLAKYYGGVHFWLLEPHIWLVPGSGLKEGTARTFLHFSCKWTHIAPPQCIAWCMLCCCLNSVCLQLL